jgi:hypothetical protein
MDGFTFRNAKHALVQRRISIMAPMGNLSFLLLPFGFPFLPSLARFVLFWRSQFPFPTAATTDPQTSKALKNKRLLEATLSHSSTLRPISRILRILAAVEELDERGSKSITGP